MKNMKRGVFPSLPLTLILVEDPKIGGYTAFFKQFPNIIAEGDTDEEATSNLMNTVHDVFDHLAKEESTIPEYQYKVIQKPLNMCTSTHH